MECLTPTVSFDLSMDNYFTSFRLFVCLPNLELTTFEQGVCSTKIGYANTLSSGINSCKNVAGKNDKRTLYIASSESCQLYKNLFGLGTKLRESIFKSSNQINSTVTTRTWVLSKEWIRTWPNTGLVSNETMVVVPVCFNDRYCSSGCVGIVLN